MKKKKENQLEKIKKGVTSYKFLYTTLGILLGIVILLGIIVLVVRNERKSINMVIPVIEENTHSSLSIDLNSLKNKPYKIKIKNYRENKINQEEISYQITIKNDTSHKIKVMNDKNQKNLMDNQKETIINNLKLKKKEKEEVIYIIQLEENEKVEKDEKIIVEISS